MVVSDPGLVEARGRALSTLAAFFLTSFRPEDRPWMDAVPALAKALTALGSDDRIAAEHQRVLSTDVYPTASIFLTRATAYGGEPADVARQALAAVGLEPSHQADPDHIGQLLAGLAHLDGATADALADGRDDLVQRLETRRRGFLDAAVLPWLPPLLVSLQRQRSPLFHVLAALVAELVGSLDHRPDMPDPPEPALDLDDEQTDIRRIATALITPASSGWFLSRGTVLDLAGRLDLPAGFGHRRLLVETLLHTAIEHQQVDKAITGLRSEAEGWAIDYRELEGSLGSQVVGPWRKRIEATSVALERVGRQAMSEATAPD